MNVSKELRQKTETYKVVVVEMSEKEAISLSRHLRRLTSLGGREGILSRDEIDCLDDLSLKLNNPIDVPF